MRNLCIGTAFALLLIAAGPTLSAQKMGKMAKMAKPDTVTLSGKVIDITCSAKGKVKMGSWGNAENNDHMTPAGKKTACATMCLKGGQPAGLFSGDQITAVFACNPRATLANYAAQDVKVKGFWAGSPDDGAKSFVPMKIRGSEGGWTDVDCATMH